MLRLTPRTSPICATVMSRCSKSLLAVRSVSGERGVGCPAAVVRSGTGSRSNSAREVMTLNTSFPPEELVSMFSYRDSKSENLLSSQPERILAHPGR